MMGNSGKCALCGRVYTKRGMSRHLKSCLKKNMIPGKGDPAKGGQAGGGLILSWRDTMIRNAGFAECHGDGIYELNQFLRIWLECCGL